ncbi:MAG: DMT family transporter [Duodenibacillus massiliensis]
MGTEVGKASFITSLYIVIVPVIGIFIGRRSSLNIWLAVILAVAGLWFLCMNPGTGFTLSLGDSLVLACALSFSFHILVIDHFAPKTDGVRMSCIQFAVGGVWGFILMMFFDPPTLKDLWDAVWMLLYAGILSNGIAYTLQIVGQKGLNPTVASLIMSFEAVVGVLAGWLFMNQALTGRELIGCAVMAAAIVLAQLPAKWFGR